MDAYRIALVIAGAGVLGVVVWVLAKLGKALIKLTEALAAAAVVLFAVWLVLKAVGWALRQTVTHWRTSLTVLVLLAWWHWWASASLVITAGVVASVSEFEAETSKVAAVIATGVLRLLLTTVPVTVLLVPGPSRLLAVAPVMVAEVTLDLVE